MLLAATLSTFGYRVFFLLHILAVIVAFAPAFVSPFLSARYQSEDAHIPSDLATKLARNSVQVHGPALVLTGLFGFGLIGLSDNVFKFSQSWISIAMVLWFIMLAVLFGLLIPAEKKVGNGDVAAESKVSAFGGMLHLLLLLMLIDMIWKPGF